MQTPEQETLLTTLYAKAQPGTPLFFDPTAQDILNRVGYAFARQCDGPGLDGLPTLTSTLPTQHVLVSRFWRSVVRRIIVFAESR